LANQLDLKLIQNNLFLDLRQTIRFRHAPTLKKFGASVQPRLSIPLPSMAFPLFMSQRWGQTGGL
jgi:hypothetical protein